MASASLFSPSELSYTSVPLSASTNLLRADARPPLSYRDIHLTSTVADGAIGSAKVRIGSPGEYTEVWAAVRGEVEDDEEEREPVASSSSGGGSGSEGGKIVVGIECAAPAQSTIRSDLLHHLSTLLTTLFSPSTLPSTLVSQLSSTLPSGKSWTLYLDILIQSSTGGNVIDLTILAARSALASVKIPRTRVIGGKTEGEEPMGVAEEGISGLVKGGKGGKQVNRGDYELVDGGWEDGERLKGWEMLPVGISINLINQTPHLDATLLEESSTDSQLVACFTSTGDLCGLSQLGEGEIEMVKVMPLIKDAQTYASELIQVMNAKLLAI